MPIPLIAGAAISGAASIASNALNSYSVKKQNEQNIALWREQQEYNTPVNQVKRLKAAGLNPALMYGGAGGGASGQTSSAPQMQRTQVDLSTIGSVISTYLDLKAKDTNIENTRANTRNTQEATKASQYDNVLRGEINDQTYSGLWKDKDNDTQFTPAFRSYMANLEKTQKEMTRIDSTVRNTNQDTLGKEQQLKVAKLLEFVPKAENERYQELGILPSDASEVQAIKVLYKMFTGRKFGDDTPKEFLSILKALR